MALTTAILALAVVAPMPAAFATTTTVANTDDDGPGSLRQAIADAGPGDTIVVPGGIYTLTSSTGLGVDKTLTISGAGAASTIIRQTTANGVFSVSGASTVATISGVTIRDGHEAGVGGGIFVATGATLTVSRSVITHNTADGNGAPGSFGHISKGGGIYNGGTLTVEDSIVTGNLAQALGGSGRGGGIASGGGISSEFNSDLTVINSTISGNTADARGGQGPPAANQTGGTAFGGGISFTNGGPGGLRLSNSTVSGNLVDGSTGPGGSTGGLADGGGLFSSTSNGRDVVLTNVTVSGNTVRSLGGGTAQANGGGIRADSSGSASTLLTNLTVTDNAADLGISGGSGGNIWPGAAVKALNTIVSGGTGSAGSENCSAALVSLGHNIDSRNQCGFGQATDKKLTDPLLGPLQDNGGPAATQAITVASPAFDAGDALNCPATDARAVARPEGAACDVGAFELEFADLRLAQTATPARLPVGATVTFTLTATNGGAGTARGTTLTDTLPAGLAFVSATPSSGTCSGSTTISCDLGDVSVSAAATVTIVARAIAAGSAVNTATASSSTIDPNPADNSASTSVLVDAALPAFRISGARITPATFRKGTKLPRLSRVGTGTTISFTLPAAATVRFAFARAKPGRRAGKRCVAVTRLNRAKKRCTRFAAAGSFSKQAHSGLNKIRFQGRLTARRSLRPGPYRLTLTARDAAGTRSAPVSLRLTMLAAR